MPTSIITFSRKGSPIGGLGPIAESFDHYFSVRLANTQALKDEVYRIRYEVYCEEFGYEPAEDFPDRKECDTYDSKSTHCLVIHRDSGRTAGCVRLVPAEPSGPGALLPFERYCGNSLTSEHWEAIRKMSRSTVCEISRLSVSKVFRRRAREQATRYGAIPESKFSLAEKRIFPYVAVSLFLAATVLTDLTDHRNAFAMMEPTLPRIMNRVGIVFQKVGNNIDYHGRRAAHFITTDSALEGMKPEYRELYEIIRESIAADFEASTLVRSGARC